MKDTAQKQKITDAVEVLKPLDRKVVKYFKARKGGKSKSIAAQLAGYADTKHASRIEKTQAYQQLEKYYHDVLLEQISLEDIAKINIRNMTQERDLGASNMALKIALDRIDAVHGDHEDDFVVVLSDRTAYRLDEK